MLKRVISGGQIGSDIAGLRAASKMGIKTGGYIPKGFKTSRGRHPEYAELYGLVETDSDRYPPRTAMNVQSSDATIQLANNFSSRGEILTRNLCERHGKPVFGVLFMAGRAMCEPLDFVRWVQERHVETLNVAGNADRSLEYPVEMFLTQAFIRLI